MTTDTGCEDFSGIKFLGATVLSFSSSLGWNEQSSSVNITLAEDNECNGAEDDFTEPETNWGVVNGFIAHNCGEISLKDTQLCNLVEINASDISSQKDLNEKDAIVVMQGLIEGKPAVVAAFEFKFMGGSMGSVVGEKFVRGIQAAIKAKAAFICVSASGGARMQEGLLSLMQMAKTSAALTKLSEAKLPFFSILTDPTMGGVSASFAMLGDIIIAEPRALIGFAGPRVIEQTVREKLPEGFQRSEFLLTHGAIDMILDRRDMKKKLVNLISKLSKN